MSDPQMESEQLLQENSGIMVKRSWLRELGEWIIQMAAVAALVFLVNTYLLQVVIVSGDSMYPTLRDRDIMLISLLDDSPQGGDIVVCRTGGPQEGRFLVKRCIATEGQTVFVDYDADAVSVNGVVLEEPYINLEEEDPLDSTARENTIYLVPEGHIFVLGDNRNRSADSRLESVGMIKVENVTGVLLLHIPLGRWLPQK